MVARTFLLLCSLMLVATAAAAPGAPRGATSFLAADGTLAAAAVAGEFAVPIGQDVGPAGRISDASWTGTVQDTGSFKLTNLSIWIRIDQATVLSPVGIPATQVCPVNVIVTVDGEWASGVCSSAIPMETGVHLVEFSPSNSPGIPVKPGAQVSMHVSAQSTSTEAAPSVFVVGGTPDLQSSISYVVYEPSTEAPVTDLDAQDGQAGQAAGTSKDAPLPSFLAFGAMLAAVALGLRQRRS